MMTMNKIEFAGKLKGYYVASGSQSTRKNDIQIEFGVDTYYVEEFTGFLVDTNGKVGLYTLTWQPLEPGDYDNMGSPQLDWR